MSDYDINNESGFPSSYEAYSPTSETTGKGLVRIPDSLSTVVQSAVLNKHQNQYETRPVGTPGTTYEPHQSDIVYGTEGGHRIVYGNRAGSETLLLLSKQGAAIELDAQGRIKIGGKGGFHLATNGDGHFVFSGDIHFVTNGDVRFKGQAVHFDCGDYNVNAKGNIIQHADGSINTSTAGDMHTTVQGDTSTVSGGDMRMATAGDLTTQASGDAKHTAKGKMSLGAVGDVSISAKGNLSTLSKGDTTINSKGKTGINSSGDMTVTGAGKVTVAAAGDLKATSKGSLTVAGDGGANVGGKGSLKLSGSSIDAQSGANKASPDWVSGGSADKPSAADAKVELQDPTIVVPDGEHIQDDVGDTFATKGEQLSINTSYELDNEYGVEDGGKISDSVMQRAKQKGVIDGSYQPLKTVSVESEGSGPTGGFGYFGYHDV